MNQSSHLFRLQSIDLQIDQFNARLEEIEKVLQSDESVQRAFSLVHEKEALIQKSSIALHKIEDAVTALKIKVQTNEAAMYGGKIRNPKELQDLQAENAALKRHIDSLENDQFEAMLVLEGNEKEHQTATVSLADAQSQSATQKAGLVGEQSQITRKKENLLAERAAMTGSINPDVLSTYERLRQNKRGIAVANIEESACGICGSSLRPAEIQTAHSPLQMTFCSNCGRILFAG